VCHNNLALVRPVMRLAAADWGRATSIDVELKMKNGMLPTFGVKVKAIPMGLDDVNDRMAGAALGQILKPLLNSAQSRLESQR
jgi:hypothetical protein